MTDEHGLPCGPGDALGLPFHNGEAVKFDSMTCGFGMVTDGGGGSKVFPVSVSLMYSIVHPRWSHLHL